MEFEDPEELRESDYEYWMKHDLLTIVQISFIASGYKPLDDDRRFFWWQNYYDKQNKIFELLLNALEANKIKATSQDNWAKASPLDWLNYLMHKHYTLPRYLDNFIFDHIPSEISSGEISPTKRSKESYQNKEVRGDEPVLKAVMRTLLDLFPKYPKDKLIELAPIRIYANGDAHSPESLKKMIAEIEGRKRSSGRPSTNKIEEINKEIPRQWLMQEKEY